MHYARLRGHTTQGEYQKTETADMMIWPFTRLVMLWLKYVTGNSSSNKMWAFIRHKKHQKKIVSKKEKIGVPNWVHNYNNNYHSMYFFVPFHWLRAHHVTSVNNCPQISIFNTADSILLMRNWNYALVWKWRIGSLSRQRVICD